MTDRRALARGPDRRHADRRVAPPLPGIVARAALDPRLRHRDLQVYLALFDELDVLDFRRVKQTWVVKRLQMSRSEVNRCLKRLREQGYLLPGPPDGQVSTYRLATTHQNDVVPRDLEVEMLRDAILEISQQATRWANDATGKQRYQLTELARLTHWTVLDSKLRDAIAA